jgi:hypothetical protein
MLAEGRGEEGGIDGRRKGRDAKHDGAWNEPAFADTSKTRTAVPRMEEKK